MRIFRLLFVILVIIIIFFVIYSVFFKKADNTNTKVETENTDTKIPDEAIVDGANLREFDNEIIRHDEISAFVELWKKFIDNNSDFKYPSSFTIFIPTNKAISDSNISLNPLLANKEELDSFIKRLMFEDKFTLEKLLASPTQEIASIEGTTENIKIDNGLLLFNNNIVEVPGVEVSKGIFYIIESI